MSSPQAPPRVIGGRYRLESSIGRGGMGTVWRAHDELLGRAVAVKEVRFPAEVEASEQSELRERTLREARATARLSHPNVVTTYDVVEEDGRPWIVMELLDARSLSEILRADGPLPPHRVAEIGLEMLAALEASHQQGVVHRDVKPGNVLITSQGRAVLTDFGIATMSGDPSMTSTGVVLGSPAYMSPERARGQRPGPEADLWSLGATLYAAAEGRPPYESDNALGTLTAVISDPVDPPTVTGPLAEAILGLLEKAPTDRASIGRTRALLRKAAADKSSVTVTLPVAAAGALDRAGRTEALPLEAAAAVAPEAGEAPRPAIWREELAPLPGPGRSWTGVLVALTALLLLGGLAWLTLRGGNIAREDTSAGDKPAAGSSAKGSQESPTRESSSAPPTEEASPSEPEGVPPGFELMRDPSGFSVAIPEGWQRVERSGPAVDFREPGGSRYLRVDQTDNPKDDAVADWTRQEQSVSRRLDGYQRIRIDPVDYRGYEAADWEFTYGNTRVLNRGFTTGEKGYALYWSTPQAQWDESRSMFDVFAQTFQPAGAGDDEAD